MAAAQQTDHPDRILILDFGSQYTQLIARRVRELGVYCEILPHFVKAEKITDFSPKGIILSGGPESVTLKATPRIPDAVFNLGVPLFGICYGMQAMAMQLGGQVAASDNKEFGYAGVELHGQSSLFSGIEDRCDEHGASLLEVWMSHGDKVDALPNGFQVLAKTPSTPIAAMGDLDRQWYGVQFHPEVTHTKQGERILSRFIHDICGCDSTWTVGQIIDEAVHNIQERVGDDTVILGLSGGVDSSVVASLLQRAIGKQLVCIFVDTGLLRLGDVDRVMVTIGQHMGVQVIKVDAGERFFSALKGVACPEAKRKIIGKLFIDIFEEEAAKIPNAKWLAQGTIYSDVIESAGDEHGVGHVIKSHHNVGGLPEEMNLKLLEPVRSLFKDEVRKVGLELGLPYEMLYCHPFPGPGLGVRILGEVKEEYADILRQADDRFIKALRANDLYDKVSQAFAVFLPVKSVAVKGDARAYEYVIALRAVETIDFMTAHWAELPYAFLGEISNTILNEVAGVSRVVYDISGKPPSTIEWE